MTPGTRRHGGTRIDVDRLLRRVDALDRFATAASGHLPDEALVPARTIVDRVGQRLAVSRDHTVVALAGATGSGKSSLFNAIAGTSLSMVGVRRPTTGTAHACVWGDSDDGLLDWLDIPSGQRFVHTESAGPALEGLVLLDLPDFDSVHAEHRRDVDRLLAMVDLVIWVTDPQKYADQVVHGQYLRTFQRHVDTTVVVLNQADRLSDADVRRCLADLTGLLTADGYEGIPVFAVSALPATSVGPAAATAAQTGISKLHAVLARAVSQRKAMLQRLSVDIDAGVLASQDLVGRAARGATDHSMLTGALAQSAGVATISEAAARSYRFRARGSIGWPVVRWMRRLRADPLTRLRLGMANARAGGPSRPEASSLPAAGPAVLAMADLAIRGWIDEAVVGLPAPWQTAVRAAARSHQDTLADTLDVAVVTTDIGMSRKPPWWSLIGLLQWLLTLLAVAGGLWILARIVLIALGLAWLQTPGTDVKGIGEVPWATIALLGGAAAGILVALLVRPVVALGAWRARRRARSRLTSAVAEVVDKQIIAPVDRVLRDYAEARQALTDAMAAGPFEVSRWPST
jgi:GTP-binding protein EngB required for normal cell division